MDYPTNLSGWEGIAGYRDTLEFEAVTGLCVRGDQLLVFCTNCTYEIQGWAAGNEGVAADITIRKIHPTVGTIDHHLALNVNGRVWLWDHSGPYIYDDAWTYIGEKIKQYWCPPTDPSDGDNFYDRYMKGFLVHDPFHHVVILYPDTAREGGTRRIPPPTPKKPARNPAAVPPSARITIPKTSMAMPDSLTGY